MNKKIRIGAVKNNLITVLNEYLRSLKLEEIKDQRVLTHSRAFKGVELEISLLRWEDLKINKNYFDIIICGSDQWLESGHKSMAILKYFNQNNCRLSMLVKEKDALKSEDYFEDKKIATSFPVLAESYLGVKKENIFYMSGSVESSVQLNWADFIFDIVSTGNTAKKNGLVEYKKVFDIGAILATTKIEIIPFMADIGLISPLNKRKIIGFDGLDGSGKSTLSKHFAQTKIAGNPTILVCPYSGDIGSKAGSLLNNGKIIDWSVSVGLNHWRCNNYVSMVYDRNIMTCLTELIEHNVSEDIIQKVLSYWEPLPDILFYCSVDLDVVLERARLRKNKDIYDMEDQIIKYHALYEKAYLYIKEKTNIEIIKIDTSKELMGTISNIENILFDN